MDFAYIGSVLLLIFGFGFVIFWHELGHFLAAKWAGVEVEQFAVGFGQALFSWRKGLGMRVGSSRKEYDQKLRDWLSANEAGLKTNQELAEASEKRRLDHASEQLGMSETEYRLNWIPLGGYVKMLGQDDLNPANLSDSPKAYNNKSIPKRMVIVSAGVVMNIILAIILFGVLFRIGFNVSPAVVGLVAPGSPAQQAGAQAGDRILTYDGVVQHDFTKISMNVALSAADAPVTMVVEHPDKSRSELKVIPRRSEFEAGGFLQIGVAPSPQLQGPDPRKLTEEEKRELSNEPVRPGETIVAINGEPVGVKEYYKLQRAVQSGQPVTITVEDSSGNRQDRPISGHFVTPFGNKPLNFAGMMPRTTIAGVAPWSSAIGKLQEGDIIQEIKTPHNNDAVSHPTRQKLMEVLGKAGANNQKVDVTVLRNDQPVVFSNLDPSIKLKDQGGRKGLGIELDTDESHAFIADVLPDSAASTAGITVGGTIDSIGGQTVKSWHDVQRILAGAAANQSLTIAVRTANGQLTQHEMRLSGDQLVSIRQNLYAPDAVLRELYEPRQTNNLAVAVQWGVAETRDLILQFYLTIRRMFERSVSPSNMMGPLGIFHQGSKIAYRGTDWLIWFLAMISANLAVVNFLPIPIVDGGLFVFLILEKIMGKPLSPKAQGIAQIVGLALIASVFLFVTYHDITRLF